MAKDPAFLFIERDWFTPNTYDTNFKIPPKKSGVYLIVMYSSDFLKTEIVYVGSSKNLKQRYSNHSVIRLLSFTSYVRFYFQEDDNYIKREVELIQAIKPVFNIQYNG